MIAPLRAWLARRFRSTADRQRDALAQVAAALGGQYRPGVRHGSVTAKMGDFPVAVYVRETVAERGDVVEGAPLRATVFEFHGEGRWPGSVSVAWRYRFNGAFDIPRHRVETGVGDFDDLVIVTGERASGLALCDAGVRAALREFPLSVARGQSATCSFGDGSIELVVNGLVVDATAMRADLEQLAALARVLDRGDRSVTDCLADNVARDALVRAANLEALCVIDPVRGREACRLLPADADARSQLLAVHALGAEARLTLDALLSRPSPERRAAIALASGPEFRDLLPRLHALGDGLLEPEAGELARTLARIGDASSVPVLLRILRAHDEEAQVEALRALGAFGTLDVVESILPRARGVLGDRAVRRAARDAVARIQERASGAGEGQVSIAASGTEAGCVSAPDDASGRVSSSP